MARTEGGAWQSKIDDCFLSYESQTDDPIDFVCNASFGLDYYERIEPVYIRYADLDFAEFFGDNRTDEQKIAQGVVGVTATAHGVDWDHAREVVARLPFLTARTSIETAIKRTIEGRHGVSLDSIRLITTASDDGSALIATINTGSTDTDAAMRGQDSLPPLRFRGARYSATLIAAPACPAGTTSPSGQTPGCLVCPLDTYANRAKTICLSCPLGMESDPTEINDGAKACMPTASIAEAESGAFRVGFEWYGHYRAQIGVQGGADADGNLRMSTGAVKLLVTNASVTAGQVELLASFRHGEFCDTTLGGNLLCRDPGMMELYYRGTVTGDRIVVYMNTGRGPAEPAGANYPFFTGITDRNIDRFRPYHINGTIRIAQGNTVLCGNILALFLTRFSRVSHAFLSSMPPRTPL